MKLSFKVWHGSRRWTGEPEIRAAKSGRAEWGAGIYASTHFETARKYSKGGGKVQLLTIRESNRLEDIAIPLDVAKSFVRDKLPRRLRSELEESLDENYERMAEKIQDNLKCIAGDADTKKWVPAEVLRNLCVNYDMTSGVRGLELSRFFSDLGIGYSFDRGGSGSKEFWIVIFDPSLVSESKGFTYEEALPVGHELKSPLEQLTGNDRRAIRHQAEHSL